MSPSILVAADGTRGGLDALRMAMRLAEKEGAAVEVLAVHDPATLRAEGGQTGAGARSVDVAAAMRSLRTRLQAQLKAVGGGAERWPVTVEAGRGVRILANRAAEHRVSRIVLGIGGGDPAGRWIARESLLELIRVVDVPVLAVPADRSDLPRRVIVAVDFSKYSLEIAREALEDLEPGAQLHLVNVTPAAAGGDEAEPGDAERLMVSRQLAELASELEIPGIAAVEWHLRSGDPADAILRLAEEVDADLIAAGSHGVRYPGQVEAGDVYGKLVHEARCALLIGPPRGMRPRMGAAYDDAGTLQPIVA